ncbi:MAG TPA: DPP IV N-terminal domain-containing protein [Sphingomicrobium sp.]|nr:DPP IV N-terminal domain-containing protein [Sphingomicrobium sp.]
MRRTSFLFAGLVAAALPAAANAALPAPPAVPQKPLTLERIFGSPSLNGPSPRGVKISPDGTLLGMLRNRPDDRERYDLWVLDTSSGEWRMLVDSEKVGTGAELSEAEKMQRERSRIGSLKGIVTYQWTPDGKSLLVPLDGDLYLANLDGEVTRLTNSKEGELNPDVSPKGKYVSFVRDQKLWVGPLGSEARAVTPGGGNIHYGEAEFVAQEELGRLTGYWWSPNDDRLAVEWFDESNVAVVTRTAIGAEETRTFEQRYPAAGTDNIVPHLIFIDPNGGRKVEADLGKDKDIYLARVDWAKDGKTAYAQILNREQSKLHMLAIDPSTGKSRVLFTETAAKGHWINLPDYKWLDDGSLIWMSERSGMAQVYRFQDGKWTQLTQMAGPVTSLDGVNLEQGRVYFESNAADPLSNQVYSMSLAGGAPTLLTDSNFINRASMDKNATRLIVYRSSPTQPSQSFLADSTGKMTAWIEQNALDADHPYSPYLSSHELARYGSIKGPSGDTLYYKMITPPGMAAGKQYPVFFQHYGGPHSQTVMKGWDGGLDQYLVDQGYIVFEIDNRGSANRGVAFEKPIYHAMGSVEVEDQKAGADYLKSLPFVDPDRIATYGWSYGGYMTLKMLEADPGTYAAGIAGAPVTKWEFYDTAYTERYMGDPRKVPEAYKKSDAIDDAGKIADPLLVLHGMSDDNVVFTNSTALFSKLQENAVPFQMMVYPGYTHSVGGPKISVHVWRTILNFLDRNGVPGGPQ